ncbi:tRNA (adenosine(37)-N6)-threonylcarbamoyltransferase complex dimerization subunit type 1 TsaB [Limnohabitans sp. B9-3]|uniref:tRNA (adenosine(37)-N6)-threonylcarbamoyltransferase complex dimerization subunit type 1 TsaB n=1 Tax=Limnohabitans sp. B9-3 TaxID=1100707 RepID=UPI000C1E7540|nr:tRNA (adenosine(37)-N6)-threonylcarbamoyltransferase complex dimerization subunit type 1 TsaB [Limnohabitans sp. B9-3]PIT71674.1 tRNA (adenosine(37)-N6)-threonylcarbamoyltransferase complex dimerization subunit type 1 TsaB [Limnohabitans sp. B9-3]
MQHKPWLALETSTDTLSIAVSRDAQTWAHTSAGGAQSSAQTLPQTLRLMAQAGLAFADLQAVVFGRGPGAFTGLRTACSVAQGLAFGADVPVLPIDTLLAVAEEARRACAAVANDAPPSPMQDSQSQDLPVTPQPLTPVSRVLAVLDARMDQVYVAAYECDISDDRQAHSDSAHTVVPVPVWRCVQEAELQNPETLRWPSAWAADEACALSDGRLATRDPAFIAAGNAWGVYAGRWPEAFTAPQITALPTASALLRLAPQAWAQGRAVPPEEALPLYIRDKVAQTTEERMLAKQQSAA